MTRKHFDTLFCGGNLFCVSLPADTPTEHASMSFRLRPLPNSLSSRHSLDLFVGFGNGEKHAGDTTPSSDPRESVPSTDVCRSGRAFRDGWQPVAVVDRDAMTVQFITRSVYDMRHICHVAACFEQDGYSVVGMPPVFVADTVVRSTTLSRNGAPRSTQFRNTEANTATHRDKARERGNALMEHGQLLRQVEAYGLD